MNQKGARESRLPVRIHVPRQAAELGSQQGALGRPSRAGRPIINYEYSDGRTHATKTFALQRDGYMVQYSDEVT